MRGRGKLGYAAVLVLPALVPCLVFGTGSGAHAAPGRSLPKGELVAHVIEKVFASPIGEVEFTQYGSGHSGFLRSAKGSLFAFVEVRGAAACELWFLSSKEGALPDACEFVFYDEFEGRHLSVRSSEMEETTLFGLTSGRLKSWKPEAGGLNVSL